MGRWKYRVSGIPADGNAGDAAGLGLCGSECVWVAKPGGLLAAISPQEVGLITGRDGKMLLLSGITVTGKKCGVICDSLLVDEGNVMDVRSKGSDSRSICIGKTAKALILLVGEKGVRGGALSQKVHDTIAGMKA